MVVHILFSQTQLCVNVPRASNLHPSVLVQRSLCPVDYTGVFIVC